MFSRYILWFEILVRWIELMWLIRWLQALTLLDYCLHAGSENVVIYFKDNLYVIK